MGQSVQDNIFKGLWPEKKFQEEVRKVLRSEPTIGSTLQEHPRAAGGIVDLSYRNIPVELKSETERNLNLDDCCQFIEQTSSYAVGGGKRLGILCVLDSSQKTNSPFPTEEGLGLLFKTTANGEMPVITLLMQGNLTSPSHFSKKRDLVRPGKAS